MLRSVLIDGAVKALVEARADRRDAGREAGTSRRGGRGRVCSRLAPVFLGVAFIAGCGSTAPMTVAVRDARTQRPTSGAVVRIVPLSFYVPLYPYPTLGGTRGPISTTTTDRNGAARVIAPAEAPFQVLIAIEDGAVFGLNTLEHPRTEPGGVTPWQPLMVADSSAESPLGDFELRLSAANGMPPEDR